MVKKRRSQVPPRTNSSNTLFHDRSRTWKEHPVVIPIIASAATAVFFMSVVIPIWTKDTENRTRELDKELGAAKAALISEQANGKLLEEGKAQLSKDNAKRLEDNAKLSEELASLRAGSVFGDANPYPQSFRLVKIGEPTARIFDQYKDRTPSNHRDWVEVLSDSPLFSDATFYKDGGQREPKVAHIMFSTNVTKSSMIGTLKIPEFKDNTEIVFQKLKKGDGGG